MIFAFAWHIFRAPGLNGAVTVFAGIVRRTNSSSQADVIESPPFLYSSRSLRQTEHASLLIVPLTNVRSAAAGAADSLTVGVGYPRNGLTRSSLIIQPITFGNYHATSNNY